MKPAVRLIVEEAPEAMPEWMRPLIALSPLTYYLEIGYGIFFRGVGPAESRQSFLMLFGLGVAVFIAVAVRFRKNFA